MKSEKLKITSKLPKGEDGYKTFSVRIKSDICDNIEKISIKTGRSRNELIGILLNYAVENCEIE